jgi:hypothetical protein
MQTSTYSKNILKTLLPMDDMDSTSKLLPLKFHDCHFSVTLVTNVKALEENL